MQQLRKAMAAAGEDCAGADEEALAAAAYFREHRPSAFYRLMQLEGFEGALDALDAFEARKRQRSPTRPRASSRGRSPPRPQQVEQMVRRGFAGSWQYLRGSDSARSLLAELEGSVARAFVAPAATTADTWRVAWDSEAEALDTIAGDAPAGEMEVVGLTPQQRKVAHQLARVLGLISETRALDGVIAEVDDGGDGKALVLRAPRRRCGVAASWAAPFSVAQIFATAP